MAIIASGYLRSPTDVPRRVSNYQARAALMAAELFATVDAMIQSLGSGSAEFQAWEYANHFYRDSTLIVAMAATLELTSEQVDELFISAAQIE